MRYDVCLSFAGENRDYVECVAAALVDLGIRVFYDGYEEARLWGKDLYQHLHDVYRKQARYCVIFASEAYAEKVWPKHELASAQARAIEENHEYILPARFDDTSIPGVPPTTGYIDVRKKTPGEVAALIAAKVKSRRASQHSKPTKPRKSQVRTYKADDHDRRIYFEPNIHDLPEPPPPRLYHYTTSEGLIGILQTKTIMAFEWRFGNDDQIASYSASLLRDVLDDYYTNDALGPSRPLNKNLRDLVVESLRESEVYVVSFTEHRDSLPMWRQQSKEFSYALGLETSYLHDRLRRALTKVSYEPEEQRQRLGVAMKSAIDAANINPGSGPAIAAHLAAEAAVCRSPAFVEEHEWCLVIPGRQSDVQFRHIGGLAIPYIPVSLSAIYDLPTPIVEVIHGPSPQPRLSERSLKMILRQYGYSDTIATASSIPMKS